MWIIRDGELVETTTAGKAGPMFSECPVDMIKFPSEVVGHIVGFASGFPYRDVAAARAQQFRIRVNPSTDSDSRVAHFATDFCEIATVFVNQVEQPRLLLFDMNGLALEVFEQVSHVVLSVWHLI